MVKRLIKVLAERGFDPRTSGLWAQHASTAPLCWFRLCCCSCTSQPLLPAFVRPHYSANYHPDFEICNIYSRHVEKLFIQSIQQKVVGLTVWCLDRASGWEIRHTKSSSVGGVKVSMVAFQAVDPGSIPGWRTFLSTVCIQRQSSLPPSNSQPTHWIFPLQTETQANKRPVHTYWLSTQV